MTTNYIWVMRMDTIPQDGNLSDVVINIHWERHIEVIDGDKTYNSLLEGDMACSKPSETDFTAFPDLTYEQVCGWLNSGLNVTSIDSSLLSLVETEINPPIVTLPNPWDVVEVPKP
jgi:hypothetical protein